MAMAGVLAGFLSGLLGEGDLIITLNLQKVTNHIQSIMPLCSRYCTCSRSWGHIATAMETREVDCTIVLPFAFCAGRNAGR